jgi:hemerythrin-like metal-binding protein
MMPAMTTAVIGLDQMESEHGMQVQLLRDIEHALRDGRRDAAMALMNQLEEFTEVHFASEQVLMRLHSYPRYFEHERQHGELLEDLRTLKARITGEPMQAGDQSAAIRQWLSDHISTADRAFVEFMHSRTKAAEK